MKTYTFNNGKLTKGLKVTVDEKFGPVISLGEPGRGRKNIKISMFNKNPPEIIENTILDAHPIKLTGKNGEFFTLSKPNNPDQRILVRISTKFTYTRGTEGYWETISGNPAPIVKGWGAHGDAGRIGSWEDGLVIMSKGDIIKVIPEGGRKTSHYIITYKNELECMDLDTYNQASTAEDPDQIIEIL